MDKTSSILLYLLLSLNILYSQFGSVKIDFDDRLLRSDEKHDLINLKDDIRRFKPWSTINKESKRIVDGRWISKRPSNPTVRIRYPVNRTFNIKRPVFIGNRAKHAAYALEGGKIQDFIQGRMAKIINDTMREKRTKGRIFLQSRQTPGFGTAGPSAGSTELNL